MEVLLEITKCCDLYLMERVVDDESEVSNNFFPLVNSLSFMFFSWPTCWYLALAWDSK